jgi:hypothetical protein
MSTAYPFAPPMSGECWTYGFDSHSPVGDDGIGIHVEGWDTSWAWCSVPPRSTWSESVPGEARHLAT